MNRVILIGNGFDLAQDLRTSYKNFIDDYWDKKSDEIVKMVHYNISMHYGTIPLKPYEDNDIVVELTNNSSFHDNIVNGATGFDRFSFLVSRFQNIRGKENLNIKNKFLHYITSNRRLQNWVDIEEEYYKSLKICLDTEDPRSVKALHKEFDSLQIALEEYLTRQTNINNQKAEIIYQKIYYPLTLGSKWVGDERYDKLLFLNFNYTNNIKLNHSLHSHSKLIHIHGELNNPENPMIFGYGDELDEKYKFIEQLNDNEYLKNMKSIKYLQARKYHELLAFIDSDDYQIFIMGHSCGISDRTLLNKLFEHKNCRSIKPFYHQKKGGVDNYTDLTINISRNFNDKSLFRERVVNKLDCEPLL